jgi:hypothetical protein
MRTSHASRANAAIATATVAIRTERKSCQTNQSWSARFGAGCGGSTLAVAGGAACGGGASGGAGSGACVGGTNRAGAWGAGRGGAWSWAGAWLWPGDTLCLRRGAVGTAIAPRRLRRTRACTRVRARAGVGIRPLDSAFDLVWVSVIGTPS